MQVMWVDVAVLSICARMTQLSISIKISCKTTAIVTTSAKGRDLCIYMKSTVLLWAYVKLT